MRRIFIFLSGLVSQTNSSRVNPNKLSLIFLIYYKIIIFNPTWFKSAIEWTNPQILTDFNGFML